MRSCEANKIDYLLGLVLFDRCSHLRLWLYKGETPVHLPERSRDRFQY